MVRTSRLSSKRHHPKWVNRYGGKSCVAVLILAETYPMTTTSLSPTTGRADHPGRDRIRALWVACGAHALHDGLTDTLYLLLPIWQAEFALGYAAIGILRALYAGTMAGLQVPAARIAQRIGGASMLAAGTAGEAAGYFFLGGNFPI